MFYYSRPRCVHPVQHTFYRFRPRGHLPGGMHVVRPCTIYVLRHLFSNVEFYCVPTDYGVMKSSQFCLKLDERVNINWQFITTKFAICS